MTGLFIDISEYIVDPLQEVLATMVEEDEEYLYYPSKMNTCSSFLNC